MIKAYFTHQDDLSTLLLCGFRYALVRQTYIVGLMAGILMDNRTSLTKSDKKIIVSEIDEKWDGLSDYDKPIWLDVNNVMSEDL